MKMKGTSAMDALFASDFPLVDLQAAYFRRAVPFRLQIECSSICSADCTYCYAKASSKGRPLSTAEIKALLRKAADMGVRQVDWMGGDPMERQDWIELLRSARYCGMTNNLWTCGSLLNDVGRAKWAVDLTEGGYIMVHLDSLEPDTLMSLRSSYNPLTTRDTLRGVELLHDLGKPPQDVGNLLMLTSVQRLEDVKETMSLLYERYGMRTCLMSLKTVDHSAQVSGMLPPPSWSGRRTVFG
jgi:MoaA/NifB/PqqE/SkfB family radical SAM enzyme